jgi:DNA polymerase-3 subunit gamma/tau
MSQALYRKWRPRHWDQVVGQEHVVSTLRNAVVADRVAHAYLFAGPRGTGKTSTARLLAKAVNCLESDLASRPCDQCEHCKLVNQGRFLDLIEIDAASNTSVEDVRDLRDKINFSPNQGRYKVYIVDEVHMLSTAAFNALLKTLEEPPDHAIFILATTEVHKIPATVLSRCQRHEFRRIPVADIVAAIKSIADEEGIQVEEPALRLVARQATGSMRDAISLIDQLASSGKTITLEMAQTVMGTVASQSVLDVIEALIDGDAALGLDYIHKALDAGSDPRQFARQIVDYLRSLLLVRMGSADQIDAAAETRAQIVRHAQTFPVSELLRVIRLFNTAANEARSTWQPALPLEMALVEALGQTPAGVSEEPAQETPAERQPARADKAKPSRVEPTPPARPEHEPVEGGSQAEGASSSENVSLSESASSSESASPSESASLSESKLTVKKVNQHWNDILAQVRESSLKTEALLKSGSVFGVKNGVLYFGFSEVLKTQMEKSDNLEVVRQAIENVLGREVRIRCVVASGGQKELPAGVDSNGMVAVALRDLGGEIVDIQ